MYDKVCPVCGTRLSDFYNTYMLGCPECYRAFSDEIEASLKKVHGCAVHAGKTPKTIGVDRELLLEYDRLVKEREDAILQGRFAEIRELTESIMQLTEELKRRGLM